MKKNALERKEEIRRRILSRGAVVMLDFDGTLVEFAPKPTKVRMRARMREALALCIRRYPTAIITGRAISAVRRHIRSRSLAYIGNHGLEWDIAGDVGSVTPNKASVRALRRARSLLGECARTFSGAWVEDKKHSICFHYRGVKRAQRKRAAQAARRFVRDAGRSSLRLIPGEDVLNILPNTGHSKGSAARKMMKRLAKTRGAVPIFIGDDATDEDAFRALRNGITIHVKNDKRVKTAARYCLKDTRDVEKFLRFLSRV